MTIQRNSEFGLRERKGNRRKDERSWWISRAIVAFVAIVVLTPLVLFVHLTNHDDDASINNSNNANIDSIKKIGIRTPDRVGVDKKRPKNAVVQKQRKEQATVNKQVPEPADALAADDVLVLETELGSIRIILRPDLSPESVAYVHEVVRTDACSVCRFHRAEKPGILQGVIKSKTVPLPTKKGSCPEDYDGDKENCHGPIMERGMVGWAAGELGPDFFIDDYLRPAKFWETQHTGTSSSTNYFYNINMHRVTF